MDCLFCAHMAGRSQPTICLCCSTDVHLSPCRASMPVLGSLENLRDESPVRSWLPPNSARSRRSHDKAWK